MASRSRWRDLVRIRLSGRWRPWAIGAFVLAGAMFATSALSADGLDLRAASVTDLNNVVRQERERSDALAERLADLNADVDRLSRQVSDRQVERLQKQVDSLRGPAGLAPVRGPGLSVTLEDAPKSVIDEAAAPGGVSQEELVVHQQDIQAVVNALWAGGAEAMTIQGQRVISTTGIKCVGNTVILHGVPYSPPYRISAIGDPEELADALDDSEYIDAYRTFVDGYGLGYEVVPAVALRFPGYTGSTALKYAAPDPSASTTETDRD